MQWIICTVLSAFLNAVWTSLTAKKDKELTSLQFTILFRFLTVIFILPFFFFVFELKFITPSFLFYAFVYAVIEGLRTIFIVKGAQEDYYATYAFVNMSPIFTVLFSMILPNEKANLVILLGTLATVFGGFLFYKVGKFSKWGFIVAVIGGLGVIVSKLGVSESNGVSFSIFSFTMLVVIFSLYEFYLTKKIIVFKVIQNKKTVVLPAFFSALATATYFIALETGDANKVANLLRTNLIFGFIMSYFILKEVTNWKTKLLGGIFILLGGVIVYFG